MMTMKKSPVQVQAEEIQACLDPNNHSFIRYIRGPYVLQKNMDIYFLLKMGKNTLSNAPNFQVGGGWRAFCNAHSLVQGDALVFHLVEPFYIVRACDVADVDNDNSARGSVRDGAAASVTETLEGVRLTEPIAEIQDFLNLDSFTILVDVNIVDAIKASKLSTPKDKFKAWEKSLKSFKYMGMNVNFLLSRVGTHLQQASAFDYNSAVMEENRPEEEIATCEVKILELRNESLSLERELSNLKETYKGD
ncbi:hypothetical protein MKW98_009781 [Papaver atlanticum]|uniref:TF-B3 domain-containing protein n=1 Tax=Papaver atlanticum TaxID=357466 RepID=A0AAD4SV68_9MAGN|nr:hypothetical protein MKW98_009781 [Papaver atlanticum]